MKIQNTFGWCMEKIETINIDRERRKRVEQDIQIHIYIQDREVKYR